jgi:hypothetical protein
MYNQRDSHCSRQTAVGTHGWSCLHASSVKPWYGMSDLGARGIVFRSPFAFAVFQSHYASHEPFSHHLASMLLIGTTSAARMSLKNPTQSRATLTSNWRWV